MTRAKAASDWTAIMFDASKLWADAGMVVALRSWRVMAGGPAADLEIKRMVSEKTEANLELARKIAGDGVTSPEAAARKALTIYGKRVQANRKRLT